MSEKEIKETEKNNTENVEVEPLSDQETDTVAGGTYDNQDAETSNICSAVWCS